MHHRPVDPFVSVYIDGAAAMADVRAAIEELAIPPGVDSVSVTAAADTSGCRIAVDLTGTFDAKSEGRTLARRCATQLSEALGVPAFAFQDLIAAGNPDR